MVTEEKMYLSVLGARYYNSRSYMTGRSPARKAEHFEVSVYLEDSGIVFINDIPHKIHRGDVRFTTPGTVLYSEPPFSAYSIRLTFGEDNCQYSKEFIDAILPFFTYGEDIIPQFKKIAELFSSSDTGSKVLMNAYTLELLYNFYNATNESHKFTEPVKLCIDYIKEHYRQKVKLEELGEITGYVPLHVLRIFKQQTGKTPHEFAANLRLMEARNLLENTLLPVSEVAFRVGFSSASGFQIAFQQKFGISPGKYRKESEVFNR